MKNKLTWTLLAFFAVGVGLYPSLYILMDMRQGLLSTKPSELLDSNLYQFIFHQHIYLGGIALLAGLLQFSKKLRSRHLSWHRALGKTYLIAVLLSGSAGLYIAFYATGGLICVTGFESLAILWLYTSATAYRAIRNRDIDRHKEWMIRSYALCFAAVTLRILGPVFQFGFGMSFIPAYQIIAWLSWMLNLLVAEIIIRNKRQKAISVA